MVTKKIQLIFGFLIVIALGFLVRNLYSSYEFKHTPLSPSYQEALIKEEQRILHNMKKNFGYMTKFPLIVSDKIPGKIYGLTSQNEAGKVVIYLNKKIMQESFDYIISDVIAHEYAHALLFANGYYAKGGKGHSDIWKQTCVKLGGANCGQYVDVEDVIRGKLPF